MAARSPRASVSNPELDQRELAAWRGLLRVHSRVIKELSAELEAAHGLTLSAYEVLLLLNNSDDRALRMSDIADAVLLSPSGMTRLVDRLCAEGLVARSPDQSDQRVLRVALTARGCSHFAEARRTHLAGVRRRFLDRLGAAELDALGAAWERVLEDGDDADDGTSC